MQVAGKPVLIDIAGDELFLEAVAVEESFPVGDLLLHGGGQGGGRGIGRASLDPARQRLMLGSSQRRQAERHAAIRVLAGVVVEGCGAHAGLRAIERKIEVAAGDWPAGRPRVLLLERQHAVKHAAVAVGFRCRGPFIEHREETLAPPFGIGQRVEAEAGRLVSEDADARIDAGRVGAARQAGVAGQVQLAGCVVAGMAGNAALVEYRAHLAPVVRCAGGGSRGRVEAGRVRLAKALVELQRSDDRRTAGDEGEEQGRQQAHDELGAGEMAGILAQTHYLLTCWTAGGRGEGWQTC